MKPISHRLFRLEQRHSARLTRRPPLPPLCPRRPGSGGACHRIGRAPPPPPPPAGPPGSGTMRLRPRGSGATAGAGQPAAQPGATPAQGNMFSQYLSQPPAGREYRQRLGADNSGDSGEPQQFAGRGQRLGSS
mmetsp:Transcript_5270/g.13414  ORF Transcript_5270/g.13414 Transcript_5270/m.13414 type:complete len:133 (+) Transcript_5270:2192-2590(+)